MLRTRTPTMPPNFIKENAKSPSPLSHTVLSDCRVSRDLHLRPAAVLVRHGGRGADRGHRRPVDVLHGLGLRRRGGGVAGHLARLPVHYHRSGLLTHGVAVGRGRRHRRQRRVQRRLRAGERVGHCLDGRLRSPVRVA